MDFASIQNALATLQDCSCSVEQRKSANAFLEQVWRLPLAACMQYQNPVLIWVLPPALRSGQARGRAPPAWRCCCPHSCPSAHGIPNSGPELVHGRGEQHIGQRA
jgi:hypothetical protein